jgi:hypothetical protein
MKLSKELPGAAFVAMALVVMDGTNVPAQSAGTNIAPPKIQFAATVFDFERIVGGQMARHDFYFTNTGGSLLRISSVNTSCGCTTAGEWSREVPPGGVGMIPLQFNSGGFSGAVTKTATVSCNDPVTPSTTLQFKATVWRPVEVAPTVAMLSVNSELVSNATAVVRVTNHATEPLEVFDPVSSNPQFTAEIRTNTPGRLFEVVVRSVPPLNIANPHGVITVRTSSTNTSTLAINAMCVVQPPVLINPPRVIIPEAEFTSNWTARVNIRNGMVRPLKLTAPAVNVPGATVSLRELEADRAYELTVVVPPSARNTQLTAELTVQSNFADYETVRVPIVVINAANAMNAQGVPMTARATKFLASPEGRRALEPNPDEYVPPAEADDHAGHSHAPPASK